MQMSARVTLWPTRKVRSAGGAGGAAAAAGERKLTHSERYWAAQRLRSASQGASRWCRERQRPEGHRALAPERFMWRREAAEARRRRGV